MWSYQNKILYPSIGTETVPSETAQSSFERHFDIHGQLRLSRALKVGTELFFVLVSPPA